VISIPSSEAFFLCFVLGAVLCTCLFLFFSAKVDLRRVENRLVGLRTATERKTEESELRFNLLETKISEAAEKIQGLDHALELPKDAVVQNGLGPTRGKRTAIIRLAQRGEAADKIAASVGMPKNEVDLLLKVHRAISQR
jgi:hypothetical protein